ncbi:MULTISPECIES: ABC transporter permease [Alphaproteobacteria]|uniref:Membrane protein n=2 Tax=Alphaproteobacteria TaxID=28211 RepID=A0A512HDK1_9HYPH|nr:MULTISPECIES: FtsX-like permease family protein [Alphaproteobacteria]GEO83525.1 membrane protein [Ciceribacter naphthalenivorans]GLR24324.1 membrane protein [Ciceribacter naphthalenivorans]GLT07180.1 membrane protein [Sphingomonas psychrolutea]
MIRFILSDLRRLWAGSLTVCLLVALSTALVMTVTLQERALRLGSARAADKFDLVIGAAGSETQLVLSSVFLQPAPLPLASGKVLADLLADPRVAWAAPVAFGDSFAGYPVVGTTRVLIENTTPGFAEGLMFSHEGEAVVGSGVKLKLGDEVKPMHGTADEGGHTHTELAYKVTGKLKATGTAWDRAILVPVQAVWHIHGLEEHEHEEADAHHDDAQRDAPQAAGTVVAARDETGHEHGSIDADAPIDDDFSANAPGLPAILVKPRSVGDAYKLRQDYRKGDTVGVFPGEVLTQLYSTLGDAKLVLSAVAIGAQILVACALLMVTVIHIGQRRRQIGALRAFGAPRLSVSLIVWAELMLVIAAGIAVGTGLGFLAARWISGTIATKNGFALPVEFARQDLWQIGGMVVFAAVLSALPALLAYRQSPAQALRA